MTNEARIETTPLWLVQAREAQAKLNEEKLLKAAEAKAANERAEAARRVQALKQFTLSLRAILGKEAVDDLLGGPNAEAQELEIESGPYILAFQTPFMGGGKNVTYRLIVKRKIAPEVAAFEYGNEDVMPECDSIETTAKLVEALANLDVRAADATRNYEEHVKRQNKIAAETPVVTDEQPEAVALDTQTEQTLAFLEGVVKRIRGGRKIGQLDPEELVIFGLAQCYIWDDRD